MQPVSILQSHATNEKIRRNARVPFSHVIITFPDAAAARTAAEGPIPHALQPAYPSVRFTATSDPYDARVGSGGGTAAALFDHGGILGESVLILHAGGAASRCPTQMCLGKAWTSLPATSASSLAPLKTPLDIWMDLATRLFVGLPPGSVVVIASDTLLQLEEAETSAVDWTAALHTATIVGLAVPAPLATAANHGVFCVPKEDAQEKNQSTSIRPCQAVLQKPTVSVMQEQCAFATSPDSAWIDTGVTIFSPRAAAFLMDVTRTHLQRCTATGLRDLCPPDTLEISEFAAQNALSMDLYTHLLQALALSHESPEAQQVRKEAYLQMCRKDLPMEIAVALWDTFSQVLLQVLTVPSGRFWHLGTTRELRDFLVDACAGRESPASTFGARLGLMRRVRAYTHLGGTYYGGRCVDPSAVILDSILCHDGGSNIVSSIGARTVVEHCDVQVVGDETIRIGQNCMVSGLRGPADGQRGLWIPDDTMVQMVRLSEAAAPGTEESAVIMVLGINDEIKKLNTLYGMPVDVFLDHTHLSERDLWEEEDSGHHTIWTAKIHPVIALAQNESFATVFSWLRLLDGSDDGLKEVAVDSSFIRWKSSRRLALSEIRDVSDAPLEFQFREELLRHRFPLVCTRYKERLVEMLYDRRQLVPVDFQFLVDGYVCSAALDPHSYATVNLLDTLHALDDVIRHCMNRDGSYDMGSRACMLMSNILDDIVEGYSRRKETEMCKLEETTEDCMNGDPLVDLNTVTARRDECIASCQIQYLSKIAEFMQEYAGSLTGRHVLAAQGMQLSLQSQPPVHDRWILAAAPARIDLSGGWSDTPPICYEFGSLVVGLAVRIDDRKPLLCRCRVLSGGTGILLRTESRDSVTGDLLSVLQKEIESTDGLMDYRNPTSDCALLMCALVHLGFAMNDKMDFQSKVNAFCRTENSTARLEVVATTTLPQGSGLGSSSILAGCILAAVGKCIGAENQSPAEYVNAIVDAVLNVEQYLTTGGGFQDQVNGLVGGIKAVSSSPNVYPMKVTIENLSLSSELRLELEKRLVLLFTGKTRLAKNLLKQVLIRWSKQTPEIIDTVSHLVNGAKKCRDAIASGNVNMLGECLSEYWIHKKVMAGPSSGVEPEMVRSVIHSLRGQGLIQGASLCGAGGGGFMVLLCSANVSQVDLQQALSIDPNLDHESIASLSWHSCNLCDEGLVVRILEQVDGTVDDFNIEWLSP